MDLHSGLPSSRSRRRLALWCAPVFAVLVGVLHYVSPRGYLFFLREYMVVEDLQFVFYLCAALLAACLAYRLLVTGTPDPVARRLGVLYAAAAVGSFLVAGEEVSWGQQLWERILPFYPDKEEMRSLGNKQGETTLHNMGSLNHLFAYLLLAIAAYGVLSAVLARVLDRRGVRRPPWTGYLVFPAVTIPALLIAVAYFVVADAVLERGHVVVPGSGEEAFRRYQEVAELFISASLALTTWLRLRVTSRHRPRLQRTS